MAQRLLETGILILDGGLGTTLEDEHGVKFSTKTPLWSSHLLVENTSTLERVQQDFASAGADIILTATYQTSFDGFAATKCGQPDGFNREEAKSFMLSAVKIARRAFQGRSGLVALSLGAYGATMIPSTEYSGNYGSMDEEDLFNFHDERISVFLNSTEWKEIDLVAFETLPRLDEVRVARRIMQSIDDKDFWISCVFPNDDERLPDGSEIEVLVRIMLEGERRPVAIGINCTKIHKISSLVKRFESAAASHGLVLPALVVYPDGAGGKVYDTELQQWIGEDTDQIAWEEQLCTLIEQVKERKAWAGIIAGGCCKTTPTHIQKLRAKLDNGGATS